MYVRDLTRDEVSLKRAADILGLLGEGASAVVVGEGQLPPEFYDLSSGFAGELLQKCVNYGLRLAVVGQFTGRSESFRQLAAECNRGAQFAFVGTRAEALARLGAP